MKISLAAKCQLLFGAAVVLIIAAALFVPWQRMDQLTDEINKRVARNHASAAVMEHVVREYGRAAATGALPTTTPVNRRPATTRAVPVTGPSTTAALDPLGGFALPPAKLFLIRPGLPSAGSTRFEQRALEYFAVQNDPEADYYSSTKDNRRIFRYALALRLGSKCMECHVEPSAASIASADAAAKSATTRPKYAQAPLPPLIGVVSVDIPSQVEAREVLLNRIFVFVAGLLAGTLAIIVFYLITTRLILQPVRVLQETAEKVSEGNLNIRSDISTGDEFQQLSETFNRMLVNLKAGEDQLRGINKSLDLKLGQLAESNVALYESNRLKNEFLANVSHELRTPLNSILGFAELLRDAPPVGGDAKAGRYVQNILNSGRNLLDLINDLLDLAKIEAGRMEVRSESLSLNDLFEGLTSILRPLAEKRSITIAATVAGDVPIMQSDPAKLQQVLYNFLANAIKFSPNGGRIDLKGERIGESTVRISVRDQGPGIHPDEHETIFEKFRQLDGSVTREHGGTGLGLAISKELIMLMNGSIGVQSAPGQGATFWVVIPLKVQPGAQDVRRKLVLT